MTHFICLLAWCQHWFKEVQELRQTLSPGNNQWVFFETICWSCEVVVVSNLCLLTPNCTFRHILVCQTIKITNILAYLYETCQTNVRRCDCPNTYIYMSCKHIRNLSIVLQLTTKPTVIMSMQAELGCISKTPRSNTYHMCSIFI